MSLHRLIRVVGVVVLCLAVSLPVFAQWDAQAKGYSQFRYEYSDNAEDGDFDTRRIRLSWKDEVNDLGTMARVQVDFGDIIEGKNEVDPKDLWVWHPFGNGWSARFGLGNAEFGHDVPYSSSKRLPFERSYAARNFLPGERAIGLLATYEGAETPVTLDLQIFGGMNDWHDEPGFDDAESLLARVQYPLMEMGTVGASYMTSDVDLEMANAASSHGGSDSSVDPDLWGFHAFLNYGLFGFRGEYFDGDYLAFADDHASVYDADGWYAEVNYTPENSQVTPFYRYDEFNYSWDMAATQSDNEAETSRHTFGVAYEPWANNRLTLQVEDIDMESDDDTTVGVQWQVKYK
jgi:hypothetical protein